MFPSTVVPPIFSKEGAEGVLSFRICILIALKIEISQSGSIPKRLCRSGVRRVPAVPSLFGVTHGPTKAVVAAIQHSDKTAFKPYLTSLSALCFCHLDLHTRGEPNKKRASTQLCEQHERGCWRNAAGQQYSPLRGMRRLRALASSVAARHLGVCAGALIEHYLQISISLLWGRP